MKRFPQMGRMWRWVAAVVVSGPFVLSGCDPNIRSVVLDGLQATSSTIAETLIQALFIRIEASDSTTTTMLRVIDEMSRMLA